MPPAFVRPAETPDVAAFFREELQRAAASMRHDATEGKRYSLRPLHLLQEWCDLVLSTSGGLDGLRVQLYVLDRLLDDVLENLTGAVPFDEVSVSIRAGFFQAFSEHVHVLSGIDLTIPADWQGVLEPMIAAYLDVVTMLNLHAESAMHGTET